MKKLAAAVTLILFFLSSAQAKSLQVAGKTFCNSQGSFEGRYTLKSGGEVLIEMRALGVDEPLQTLGTGSWNFTGKGQVQVVFQPFGDLWAPAVSNFRVVSGARFRLVDLKSYQKFIECK